MHRIAATPGGWNPQGDGVVFLEQTPAPIVVLTAADTDIQTLAAACRRLPAGFPAIRAANLLHLQQQLTIDTYAEEVLSSARAIMLRLLGGKSYWSYGFEVLQETVERTRASWIVLPGGNVPDPDLSSFSTVALTIVDRVWRYFTEGGTENLANALKYIANTCLEVDWRNSHQLLSVEALANPPQPLPGGAFRKPTSPASTPSPPPPAPCPLPPTPCPPLNDEVAPPKPVPRSGTYSPNSATRDGNSPNEVESQNPRVGILFYRAHYLAGNTRPIDALCEALRDRNLTPIPIFVSSLREPDDRAEVLARLQGTDCILNTTSFAIASQKPLSGGVGVGSEMSIWQQLDAPALQVILAGTTLEQWQGQTLGLSPRDLAMNVVLPETDGRIVTRAISFKAERCWDERLETQVVGYEPLGDRIAFVAELAARWATLRRTLPAERKIALVLANYPTKDGRIANGVGLDTPASCIEILKALQRSDYAIANVPATGDELIRQLTQTVTNDPESWYRSANQTLARETFLAYFSELPKSTRAAIEKRWGNCDDFFEEPQIPISGLQWGNIFVGIQPARGYDRDPSLNYHAPDLEPTPHYLAFYFWLRKNFQAHAIVHVGKHGNLEWLPGKSIALSDRCYPEIALGPMPHLYPFIVNDPGEGAAAKRRSQAVIIDHLTPPMTRAELYGNLQTLEGLVDEYYEATSLDPKRLPILSDRIAQLLLRENLDRDLGFDRGTLENELQDSNQKITSDDPNFLAPLDTYLCELKEAQIRDGLHIFGCCPEGRQLRDLLVAIARFPGSDRLGLTRAIARDLNFDFDPLTDDGSQKLGDRFATVGDAASWCEERAAELTEKVVLASDFDILDLNIGSATRKELQWMQQTLLPKLRQSDREIINLLAGLDGRYVPPGASGAPTRGRVEALPTGRNFYSTDVRAIPTEAAWAIGRNAAEVFVERYVQDNGEYPASIALSVWGTSTMRTGGDDIAEALALLGVRPVWDGASRRVVDFEILPLSILQRPRVDVMLRVSGFFRDGFPNIIDLFDRAVVAVADRDETPEDNPLAARVRQETELWQQQGLTPERAERRSRYRVFGSKPGAYGAGLQGLIESQNWTDDSDIARAYINWSAYAYGSGDAFGVSAPEAFDRRLRSTQAVLHNQDNREHDLLDSDDYYQFQGGLTAAVRSRSGSNPATYFGDNALPEKPKVRQLREEIARVYRSRAANPKWIAGVMRHGYKGAFEMAATVDYLFAYDATARCVEDFMYAGIAEAYVLDGATRAFVEKHNPWALRDMAERLLEAHQRGLWSNADPTTIERLRDVTLQAEGVVESQG